PKDENLMYTLGAAYERKGEHEKSIARMREVLELDPENANAMNHIAYTLAQMGGDFDEAEKLVGRALELKPDTGAFLDSLGWIYFHRGEYARAAETLERAVAQTPGEPTMEEHLGDAYARLAKKALAADAYRKALDGLKETPEMAESKNQRAAIERKLKMLSIDASDR